MVETEIDSLEPVIRTSHLTQATLVDHLPKGIGTEGVTSRPLLD